MHATTKALFALGLFGFGLSACQTTANNVTSVDKARGAVSFYSAGDKRSTLTEPEKVDAVKDTEVKLKEYLRTHRNDVETIIGLAQVQVAAGSLDDAEKNCFTALRLDLKNRDARKVLAQIALRRGNYDLASIFLNGAGGEQSKDSNVLNMLAMVELSRGNNTDAMSLFKKAITVNGNDMAARMNLGVLLLKYRQLSQAAVEFERVLKQVPNHSDAKIHLAIIKAARGQSEEAKTMIEEVLKLGDKNPLALYNLAVLQRDAGQYDEAMENLKAYLKTTRGKTTDNDQVFALVDDIQKNQADKGQKVSDEEIQQMAAQAGKTDAGGQPQQVAKAEDGDEAAPAAAAPATAAVPAQNTAPVVEQANDPATEAAKAAEASLKLPDNDESSSGNEDIGDLEKALAH